MNSFVNPSVWIFLQQLRSRNLTASLESSSAAGQARFAEEALVFFSSRNTRICAKLGRTNLTNSTLIDFNPSEEVIGKQTHLNAPPACLPIKFLSDLKYFSGFKKLY